MYRLAIIGADCQTKRGGVSITRYELRLYTASPYYNRAVNEGIDPLRVYSTLSGTGAPQWMRRAVDAARPGVSRQEALDIADQCYTERFRRVNFGSLKLNKEKISCTV